MNYYRELYLLENTEDKTIHFIYGLTVECEVEEQNKAVQKIPLNKKTGKSVFNLLIKKDVLSTDGILQELKESKTFKFKIYNHEISIEMYPRPKVIQPPSEFYRSQGVADKWMPPESFTGEIALVETYWILDKTEYLISIIDNGKNLPYEDFQTIIYNLISQLQENTRLSFNGAYASRIGNYECFSSPKILRKGKISIKWPHNENDKDRTVNKISVERSEEHLDYNYFVNIVLRNNLDIILDKYLHMGKGQTSVSSEADEPISRYQVKVYDENGDLIFQEGHVLIREISMNMNIMEGNYNIQRPISGIIQKRLKSDQKATVKEKLDQVTKISHNNPIMVGGYKEDPWNTSSCDIRTLIVDEIMHKDLNSWWFPTGALEETECFLFLKQLLGKTNNSRVIIVDPYLSSFSLASFFPVLKNLQAEYTVLTGLFGIDPNTNKESDVGTEKEKFVQLCEKNSGFLPAKLTIINAAKSQKPLFHDRYILTYDNDGKQNVYSLSNSLNRPAGLYPMCISKLEPGTVEHVSEYVENLLKGHYPDQNGNLQAYKPEEIWSAQKSQQAVSTPKKLITENGPEDYFCWDSFWGKLFNLSDKQKLLNELKKKAIIKKQGDQFIWDIEPENLAEMIEVKPDKTVSFSENELTLFIIGLGETLARTTSDKENFDLYVWLNNKKSIYNTKLYSSVSKYYENLTYHPFSRQDLSLQVLIESRIFDIDLVTNCLHLLDYPLFPGRTKWGFSHLMDQAIDHDHENFFKWASLKSGFLDFHIQLINRMRYIGEMPDDIYPFLLKNDSPFFKALAVASLLKEINHNSTDYTVNDFIEILQSSDYADTDILWILSSRASGYMLGNTADEEKKKNTEAYLKGLLPLYTDYLSDSQQKNLVSALKNIEIIHIFAKLTASEYQDQGKTLFLWKACVEQFDNKLEEDRFYAGGDINLLLEISGEALINSNPGIPVDQIFLTKYRNNWDSIVDELIIPFSYRDHGFCYKSIGNSIFLLYVGYVVLILDAEVTSNGNKELELYLYDQILKLAGIEVGLKGWPDHTKSGILNRVINLVTHYYRSYGQIAVKDDINKIIEDIKSALLKKSEENPNE